MLRFLVGNLENLFSVQHVPLYNKYMWVLTDIFSLIVEYRKKITNGISNNIHLWDICISWALRIKCEKMHRFISI
jgi:hypothetical protein